MSALLDGLFRWTLPEFGTATIYAVLICAAYTFAVSISAAAGKPRLLASARLGAYATCGLAVLAVLLLSYAFVTHDFRISYVSRYSNRGMDMKFLFAALWGGQDGSLLWWLFLLSLYVSACVWWLEGKYRQLQPYVISTLMVVVGFFAVLMLFAANPFAPNFSGARVDGDGLNPLLQNFYMIIHPPMLYTGFVGCSVPFAFAVAALATGRLDNEWIVATRKWMLFAWLFLSVGNLLGMKWAYEALGWGGYWAWDPVENAAALPWFTASAYVHSTIIQERRQMLKVWNVILICLTFFLTIFGTFLTRSGVIASVHSFAKSDIGIYFVYFMIVIAASSAALISYRWKDLHSKGKIESLVSREAAFLVNNWALIGILLFVVSATMWPKLSELFWEEEVTVGPPFFNTWMAPIGLLLLALMGAAPLLAWRRTTGVSLRKAFRMPGAVLAAAAVAHLAIGDSIGFPAIVPDDAPPANVLSAIRFYCSAAIPVITVALVAFNLAVVWQEFQRGVRARRKNANEGLGTALVRLVAKSRRRYGGYVVHVGIALMFLGFVGKAWEYEAEASLVPGEHFEMGDYTMTYTGTRMVVKPDRREIYADVDISRGGESFATGSPAKFVYFGGQPSSEVSIIKTLREDVYLIIGGVDPQTKRATFRFHLNPLVSWIWIGGFLLIGGALISLWPEVSVAGELGAWGYVRLGAGATTAIMMAVMFSAAPASAMDSSPRARSRLPAALPGAPVPAVPLGAGVAVVGGLGLGALAANRRRRKTRGAV